MQGADSSSAGNEGAAVHRDATLQKDVSVIIPANNEERYIGHCLSALLAQDNRAGRLQIIVAANACTDRTEDIVRSFTAGAQARGWTLHCLADPRPGKAAALNRADRVAEASLRVYLDADIVCEPDMFGKLRAALDRTDPAYATGRLVVAPARSWVTRAYGRFWSLLPFVRDGGTGAGLFAVNAAGRRRWDSFPPIIADDHFVRLSFAPSERIEVASSYTWPMVEGLENLIRVRRRQDAGVAEVDQRYPRMRSNEGKRRAGAAEIARLALQEPVGFVVYTVVRLIGRLQPTERGWSRGR